MKDCIEVKVTVIGEDAPREYSLTSRDDLKFSTDGSMWSLTDIDGKEVHFPAAAVYVEVR